MIDIVKDFHPETKLYAGSEAITTYKNDGVICLRNVFNERWLSSIETGIAQYCTDRESRNDAANVKVKHKSDKGSFHYATLMWKEADAFREIIFESHAPDLFGSILETEQLNLYYDFLLIKEPGCTKAITPWHQDHSYYCLNGHQIINCWIALDPIPQETSLRFVKGSHVDYPVHKAVHFVPGREYNGVITERPLPPDFDNLAGVEILSCELNPGDALVWNSRTFHSAPGNTLDQRRAALSLNFCGDDVTYFDMAQDPDPPIRGEHLIDGGNITCESFPLLRQKEPRRNALEQKN
jgi:ectoine hydroxylase-related dioxygenase (phytanoyl-CoA dioxygenase family)